MLYLIYGNDWQKARAKAREILDALRKKKPDAALVALEEGGLSDEKLDELCGSQGLFERKFIVMSDRISGDVSYAEILENKLPAIAASENVFIFLEDAPKASLLKAFEKYAAKVQEFKKLEKKERFNSFALADALGERNKEKLWVLYQMAMSEGLTAEELHGTLFWQIKTLRAASRAKSAAEAGLKPFVWSKAKRFLSKWQPEDLSKVSGQLVALYHDSRRGEHEMETGLEKWILDLPVRA
ncbi:MAG: hypothetical protein HYV68_02140 [Candidatus Taylorbacteria bacterium]|nr:hypothetical protein [Candidatus Taylorbacteria bacterium]